MYISFYFTDVINSSPNMLKSIDGDFQGGRSTAIVYRNLKCLAWLVKLPGRRQI